MISNRRVFVIQSLAGASVIASASLVSPAQAQDLVRESDGQAKALGYTADASKADKTQVSQVCRRSAVRRLCALPGQGRRRDGRLPVVRR